MPLPKFTPPPSYVSTYTVGGHPASKYQEAVLRDVEIGIGDTLVVAAAGSGKSTTIVEAMQRTHIDPSQSLILAFNTHIKTQMASKLQGTNIKAQTIHSVGNQVLTANLGKLVSPDARKYNKLSEEWLNAEMVRRYRRSDYMEVDGYFEWRAALGQAVNMTRLTLTSPRSAEDQTHLSERYGYEPDKAADWIFEGVAEIVARGEKLAADENIIDWTDMLWLPFIWNLDLPQYKLIAVDEAQDLNALQRRFVLRMRGEDGRILWVGDPDQSIMAFAGADIESFYQIEKETGAIRLPLSISYRCPLSHIRLAQEIVPTIEPRPGAPEGTIEYITEEQLIKIAQPRDLILCRRTAPLVSMALQFIAAGRPARVRGQDDFGKGLAKLATMIEKKSRCTFKTFESGAKRYLAREMKQLEKRESGPAQIELLNDKINCLLAVYHDSSAKNMTQFIDQVKRLFEDARNAIMLSTVHRAKGLEADRVFILKPSDMPLSWKNQQPWEYRQELNIRYVALTRAKQALFFVDDPDDDEPLGVVGSVSVRVVGADISLDEALDIMTGSGKRY